MDGNRDGNEAFLAGAGSYGPYVGRHATGMYFEGWKSEPYLRI